MTVPGVIVNVVRIAGLTEIVAVLVMEPSLAVIVAVSPIKTLGVVIVKVAEVAPPAIVTVAGTVTPP